MSIFTSKSFKSIFLAVLMVTMSLSAGIVELHRSPLADANDVAAVGAGCAFITRASGEAIYVDPVNGSDAWDGTWSCPKATLSDALNESSANDEIVLYSGQYHENVTVDGKDNLLIRAASGARVVFDGTQSIAEDMDATWTTADSDGIQEVTLPVDGWQLFLAYDEQVPARWPNAQFSDESVFNRSYWAEGTLTGSNNAYTIGWLTDAGPETGVHTGLNETINATGLNPVGAIAVMNLGSFRSNSRVITDWNSANGTFAYDGSGVGWKTKHHAYFLEGKRELIDVDGEWWFNNANNRLHYKTPSGQDANNLDLRVKVQPFAISVENSDGVTIQGLDFFGTTVNFNQCDGCSFTNSTLEYPSTSKRGLGIAGESEDDRWMTRFYRSKNSFVDNISITNTDGGAIEFQGSPGQSHNNTVNNSYFNAIDWSAADQKGLMVTIYEGGRDMYFTNNTVHLTGASSVLSIGDAPKVFYNEVWDVGHLQTDGAVVQIMQAESPGAEIAYNWIHDIIKYGIRFDAPIGQIGEGRNGTMHHNVIWNAAGGLMVKGDYHNIHNNTVFNSSASKNDIIALTDGDINNKNSTFHRNAIDSMADHRSDDVHANPLPNGTHWGNWNGYLQGYDGMFEARNQISCAIYDNGSLYCWGRNDHGQLGLSFTSGREEAPQHVDLGTGRTITFLGIDDSGAEGWEPNSHACAVLDNGELVCWGANGDGQLGIGNTSTSGVWEPTTVNVGSGLTTISVAVGNAATCALLSDHSVKCWGKNNVGQLGLGNSSSNDVLTPHAVSFSGSSNPISLHAGRNEFCAQLDNGLAACWGENAEGQFGLGNTTSQTSPISLTLPTGRTVASMSVSKDYMCMALDNGSVVCAGRNAEFQLGQGTQSARETSWKYVIGLNMVAHTVELGQDVGCAHLVNGSMACWGEDAWGLFGNSTTSYALRVASTATQYANFGNSRTAASISLNYRHACAVLDNGDLTCWGRNHKAQLGLGNTTQEYMPVVVSNVSSIRQVAVHEMLVDPANDDFRPKWGSPLHQLSAGAYDARDADPWNAGVSWTYSPMSDPISGCMDSIAINYNSNAVFADGSCTYTSLSSSSSTLSLEVGVSMTPYTLTYNTPFLADDKQTAASSGSVGSGTNIALDSNGAVHICSKTVTTDNLYYTTNASGSWQSATLDSSGNVGGDCFIILDSDDDIHITYRDDSNSNLKYATKALSSAIAASNWAVSTMDNNGNVGNFGSMVVDANDTLHVAYYSANGAALKYATLADGSTTWSKEVVESTNDVGKYTSIALDSNGNPHITYHDDTNDDLRYTHKMGSSWAFTTLDSVGVTGKGTSLAIDSNDHLHVAYKTNSTEIAYMTNRTGSWVKTTLDANSTGTWGVNYINIMLDEGDDPHVVYSDMVDYDIFYMSNTRGMWERILVAGDSTSKTPEAEMDENGGIHVSYYIDGSFDDIGYAAVRSLAHRPQFEIEPDLPNGVFLGAENGTIYGTPSEFLDLTEYTVWANTTRTSALTTFSMNVDWELMSSVDYLMTPRNTAITPITFNWTAWTSGVLNSTSSVYTSGNSGDYNSIAVDSNDKVHIVFYRDDNSNLYHTTNASGSWSTSSIETNNNVGKYCSIAIDSNDGLHVSYQYNTGNALKYAYKASGSTTWSRTTVDNTGGKFTSIAVDSNDKPHIAYRDSGGDVGYAEKTGSSWTYGTVQTAGDIASASIAIDSDDHIHIAYYDSNNNDMFHLTNTSGSWAKTFLEDIGSLSGGMAVDIAIDPTTDQPGISYFDKDATALKYTYYTGSSWSSSIVENGADYGRFNSIAYDSLGNVHISHERNSADDLYYTSDKTGSWVSTAIDTTNSVGLYTAIAVDSNDDIHIAYRYNSYYDVYHATVQGYKTGSVARTAVTGATCSISPSLPNGLTLNQGTCTISGTPTSDGSNTTYNLTATSSTGVSKSGEFNIWVTAIAPSIAYTGSPFTFTVGTPITSITPSNTGDSAFWSVSSFPSGLSISGTGVISGTPTATSSTAFYTITASNSGGESTATISITVNAQPPSDISYSPENMTLEKGTAMTPNLPSASGGTITSWEISPSLPSGLTWGTSDGKISGTPLILQTTKATYTVWANNSGGSTSRQVNITINDVAPSISYSNNDITGTKNVAISPQIGPTTSGGTITSWEISPSPGSAFHFNTANGYISGTPSIVLSRTQYTIWANNSGGSSVAYVNVTINDVAPNTVVYSPENMSFTNNSAIITNTPTASGGPVTSWEISPALPSGLSFGSTNGSIWGTPTVELSSTTYTIWANNSGGSSSGTINITVNDVAPVISYSTTDITGTINVALSPHVGPTTSGGTITSWEISPDPGSAFHFNSNNGSISGTPSILLSRTQYTIWANNSGGSSVAYVNVTINDVSPGPFEYIPENNTWTNNTEVHLAPQFINQSTGNGSTWQVADINSGAANSSPGFYMDILVGDTLYFSANDGSTGSELWAYNTSNHSTWRVADIFSGSTTSWPGAYMHLLVGDTIYFSADDGSTGHELWAHDTSNHSTWQVADINSGSGSSYAGSYISMLVGDTLYFGAQDGSTGYELWAHDTSNHSTWQVIDLNSGSGNGYPGYSTGNAGETLVGDTIYFAGNDGSTGRELWAHDTSNHSTWQVADIYSGYSNPGTYMMITVGDTLYFDASDGTYRHELWAHDTSNHSTWRVADISSGAGSSNPGQYMDGFVVGDTVYFSAADGSDGSELWAHDTSNHSTWQVADINTGSGHSKPGEYLTIIVGDTLYFDASDGSNSHALWAHDTSNRSTWRVSDIAVSGHSYPDTPRRGAGDLLVGDTLYFSASDGSSGNEWWAHDTSNHSTWQVADINSGAGNSDPGNYMEGFLVGDTMYFSASDGSDGRELWAHRPLSIGYNTNTGGAVTSWAINNTSLPTGLTFSTSNGTIYGTPTQLWNRTAYKVWANNSGGSTVAYLNITVNDVAPVISYSTTEITGTKDIAISPHVGPTTSGGTITSWEISPDPGSAFHFNTGNGYISGTPSILLSRTQYTIWANNSGGSSVAYVNVTVVDEVPTLSYSPSTLVLTINNQSSDLPLNATLTGTGTITSWAIHPTLPAGLNFGTSNGTIWGIPTVMQTTATAYTIWANNTGGSSSFTITLTVNDEAPGPFEYNPENNTWTNNTEVHLAPQFINQTTGNGSTWQVVDIRTYAPTGGYNSSTPGSGVELLVGDTMYFAASTYSRGKELWAHNASNGTTWLVSEIRPGISSSGPGGSLSLLVGDTLYFSADDGSKGIELWAHDTSNRSTWRVTDINSGSGHSRPGQYMQFLVGDTIYFSADDGSTGQELWAHNTSSHSTWRVADIRPGSSTSYLGQMLRFVLGDTIYFSANDGSTGNELWSHNTSSNSTSRVIDLRSGSQPSIPTANYMNGNGMVVGDTIYFSALDGSGTGMEMWAHDTSNASTWQVTDINSGGWHNAPGYNMAILVGDTIYFDADDPQGDGNELWAHNVANGTTWQVTDISSGLSFSYPGDWMSQLVGDTLYFSSGDTSTGAELWAHDTSNHSTWQVADINSGTGGSRPGYNIEILVGDTLYFSAGQSYLGHELWAHDTSNGSTWRVEDINTGSDGSNPGEYMYFLLGDTLYFSADDGSTGHELWAHRPSSISYQTNSGGNVTTWAINASLPSGVSFGTNNGTIYGTPTELWTQTSYMVWANNSGGSTVAYLNITVVDELPTIAYSPVTLNLTNNTASSDLPLSPTVTGSGTITSWAINATLPTGLTFETSNGTIWGTPTELWTQTAYMVLANNSGGQSVAYLNITVVDEVPMVAYSPNDLNMTNNTASSDLPLSPTVTGSGEVVSWSISPSVPSGLAFDASTGVLSGTPTQLLTRAMYTITATNTGGTATAYINITIVDEVPTIAYSPNDLNMTNNTASSELPLSPTITGSGEITSWAINATLPSGLNFGTNNGTIYGIAMVLQTTTAYTIWANNSGGSSVAYLNITVDDRAPSFAYSPENLPLTNNTVSSDLPLVPTVLSGAGAPTDWVLIGTLPAGLNFGTNNGTIWGTPTELWTTTSYTVYGNNTGGSFNVSINITVNDQMPTLSYSPANLTLYNNTASSDLPLNATLTGPGEITSWAIAPDLPNGLTFEPSNGTIWGIPTQRLTTTQFMVWANNSGGSTSASLNITVLHEAPMFTYPSYNLTLVNNTAMTTLSPTITGGEITSWAIEEAIPTGLTLDSISGAISGTPTVVQNRTMYQIWANNSGGSHSVYLNITIYDPAVDLQYNPENLTLTRDVTMSDLVPIYSGIVDDWTIVPGLPSGLVFTDGVISGTPDVNMTRTTYTVWANNSGGTSSHTVNITILEPIAMLDYNPENMTLVRGTQMSDMVPTVSGGMVEFWSIHPDLPAGLLFDNGTVSGTPTVNMTTSMFTVYANNTGGSASHNINLTILEPSGDLSYTNITLTRNVSMTPLSPSYSGGVVEVWAIHPALPNGLNFSNGVISGTPLVNLSTYMFTVYANNSGGVASATLNITIIEPIVMLVYNPDNRTLIRGVTMNPLYPSVSGGSVEEWGIEPAPPLGITFANGVFSGTPVNNMTQTQYLVFANTTGGTATAWVNITVLEPAVNLTYDPYNITLIRNQTMLPVTPTIEGGSVEFWAIEPDLPVGLVFNEGTISGTPQVNMTTKMFTVWANTTGGASSTTLNITIVEPLGVLTYNPSNLTLTRDVAMVTLEPNLTMGVPSSWEIEPELPQGLVFNNGFISGTPAVNMTHTVYTVWANHSGGSASAVISITVNEPIPIIGFTPDSISLMRYEAMNNSTSISDGGFVETWSISPDLPDGLVFAHGSVSGTPLVNMTATTFTITATNTGGSVNTTLTITVLEPPANLSIDVDAFVLTRGEDELNFTINNSGGFVATWEVEPALPLGVSLVDGVVHGTPLVNRTQVTYTVWANNTGGSDSLTFVLTILEPAAIIEYPTGVVELVNGVSVGYIVPLLSGGQPATWEIYPDLPEGMELVNGLIVGVPESNLSQTVFTVWANNTGGSSQANFTLEIDQPFFMARYPQTIIVLDVYESIGPLTPLYYFDENDEPTWTISPALPLGMEFTNGTITGVGLVPQNLTTYTVQVTGEMVPVTFTLMIEIIGVELDAGIPSLRNETEAEPYVVPEPEPKPKFDFEAYWILPIIIFMLLMVTMMIATRFIKEDEQPELNQAETEDEDEDS